MKSIENIKLLLFELLPRNTPSEIVSCLPLVRLQRNRDVSVSSRNVADAENWGCLKNVRKVKVLTKKVMVEKLPPNLVISIDIFNSKLVTQPRRLIQGWILKPKAFGGLYFRTFVLRTFFVTPDLKIIFFVIFGRSAWAPMFSSCHRLVTSSVEILWQ